MVAGPSRTRQSYRHSQNKFAHLSESIMTVNLVVIRMSLKSACDPQVQARLILNKFSPLRNAGSNTVRYRASTKKHRTASVCGKSECFIKGSISPEELLKAYLDVSMKTKNILLGHCLRTWISCESLCCNSQESLQMINVHCKKQNNNKNLYSEQYLYLVQWSWHGYVTYMSADGLMIIIQYFLRHTLTKK